MKKTNLLLLLLMLTVNLIRAQSIKPSVINSSGGVGKVNQYYVDFSFCEISLATTYSTPGLIVTQGVLQNDPFVDHTTGNEAPPVAATSLSAKVYPNPSSNQLCIEAVYKDGGKIQYQLTDMSGKVVMDKCADILPGSASETLDLSKLAAGFYLLRLSHTDTKNTSVQTWKIQKTN